MTEQIKEKTITTELRPLQREEGWNFYMSLKCRSDENADIFNVIDNMEFKLVVARRDDERENSEMEDLFETTQWVPIEVITREQNGFKYFEGCLDVYELTGSHPLSLTLSNCLEDVFPDIENDDEMNERVENLYEQLIDNMVGDGVLNETMEKAVAQYTKTYFQFVEVIISFDSVDIKEGIADEVIEVVCNDVVGEGQG